jgi:DNA-binding NarL/FixJ family response regulator
MRSSSTSPSPLDAAPGAEVLGALREALAALEQPQRAVPARAVRDLARAVPPGVGATIDLRASRTVGAPVVVLWRSPAAAARFDRLSKREREVAALVVRGMRNREISRALFIAESTVKDHVHHILAKTGLRSRAALIAAARPQSGG